MKRSLILIAFVIAALLVISVLLLSQAKSIEIKEVWIKAPNGNKLYSHIHKSADASAGNKSPGLVIVPGGSGAGTQFDSGEADDIVRRGFIVMHFDPEGRGRSEGRENYNGYIHQDDLYAVILYLKSLPEVNGNNIGVFTRSYGINMGAGTLARYPELGVKYLIDWEGPSNRTQHYQDWNADGIAPDSHIPEIKEGKIKITDDWFWNEREASTFISKVTVDYLRIQGEIDHVQGRHKGHAIDMLNSATSGKSAWTRCNDNLPNILYNPANVTQYRWLPGRADERHKEVMLSWIVEMSRS